MFDNKKWHDDPLQDNIIDKIGRIGSDCLLERSYSIAIVLRGTMLAMVFCRPPQKVAGLFFVDET